MNNRQVIKLLKKEAKNVPPNNLAEIRTKLNIPNNKLSSLYQKNLIKILASCSCVCVVSLISAIAISSQVSGGVIPVIETELNDVSYISLSVDPIIELKISNSTLKTMSSRALNKDGAVVLYEENVEGTSIDDAMECLLNVMDACGYIEQSQTIYIDTIAIDQETTSKINESVEQAIQTYLNSNAISTVTIEKPTLSTSLIKKANKYNLSPSKYNLIQKVVAKKKYTLESLINKSIADLNNIYYEVNPTEIETYKETLDEKYNKYIHTTIENDENVLTTIKLYSLACNIIGAADKYLKEQFLEMGTPCKLPPKIDFLKEQFNWLDFIKNKPCSDIVELTPPAEHPTFQNIQNLLTDFFTKINSLDESMSIHANYFLGFDHEEISETFPSLETCRNKFIDYVNLSFRLYFSHYLENEYQEHWNNDFKKTEIGHR